jgi:hypothetical protein
LDVVRDSIAGAIENRGRGSRLDHRAVIARYFRVRIFWWPKRSLGTNEHLYGLRPRKGWPFRPGARDGRRFGL